MKRIKGLVLVLAYAALAAVSVYGALEARAARESAAHVERVFFGPAQPVDPYPGQRPTDYTDLIREGRDGRLMQNPQDTPPSK